MDCGYKLYMFYGNKEIITYLFQTGLAYGLFIAVSIHRVRNGVIVVLGL